jgi:acyl-CoA thioester hydrolase, YbgC/YbaW family
MIVSETKIRVRFAETDGMKIAYHGNYLGWFEAARVDMLDMLETPYKELDAQGFHLPVLEIGVRYLKSAFFDDILTVRAMIKERPGVRIRIDYEVGRGEDKLCEGFTKHAFVNGVGLPIKPPADFIKKLRVFFDASE